MKITLFSVWRNNFYVRKEVEKLLVGLREQLFDEMIKSGDDAGSQLHYIVGDDLKGLGEKRESGAIGVHAKSASTGKCSAYCHAINELQLVICKIRGDA